MNLKQLTKWSFRIHSWLGLVLGLFYLFLGVSGSLLVFQKELEKKYSTDLHHIAVPAYPKRLSLDCLYRRVVKAHPHIRQIMVREIPQTPQDCYEFMLYDYQQRPSDNYLYSVFVNPYTGEAIREGNFRSPKVSFFRWLYSAHYCFQIDKPGRLATAVLALLFILSSATGIIVYRRQLLKVITFRVKFKFGKTSSTSSLHRVVGVWTIMFNFVLFFTGFWMNKSLFLASEWRLLHQQQTTYLIKGDLDSIVSNARKIAGFTPISIKISVEKEMNVVVSGQFASTTNPLYQGKGSDLYFGATTNQLQKIERIEQKLFSDRFYWAMKRLHVGAFDNILLRWLYVLIGLSPAILSLTGFSLYCKRKKRHLLSCAIHKK